MTATFPGGVKDFGSDRVNGQVIVPADINDLRAEVIALETYSVSKNILINGGFDYAQRQAPGALTIIVNDGYSADRWRISRQNADLQYLRNDGLAVSTLTSQYYGTFRKITNAGKFMVYQIVEGMNSVPLRGKTVVFSVKMRASASKTIRMAILELQSAGTIDAIPATFITAWGANSVDPTLGANLAVVGAVVSQNLTTSFQEFTVSATVPTGSKNLICAVWSDSQFAVNDTLSLAEAGLYFGPAFSWRANPAQAELAMCERYYCKTFPVDTAPAQNAGLTGSKRYSIAVAGAVATAWNGADWNYPVTMRIVPALTFYNPSAANAFVRNITLATNATATAGANISDRSAHINCTGLAAWAVGNDSAVHIAAEAEL